MGNRQNLTVTETDEPFAQARFGFVVREARCALPRRGQTRRKFVEAVNARDFFDQINFALDLGAPGRLRALPCGEERAFRAAVLIDSNGGETESAETGLHLLVGNVRTHHAKNFGARHVDFFRGALAGININNAREQFAAGKLQNQFSRAARGKLGHFRIGAAAEARGCFSVQFQKTRGAANRDRFEPGAFDQNIFRGKRNFRFRAAHDSADAHGARAVAIADHADVRIELALDAVERSDFFAGPGAADDDFVVANFVVIESVQRVAEFEHHVIRNIDDVADAGDAGSFEAVFQPFWGRLDLDVSNDAGGEAPAEFRGLNFDFYGVAGFRRTFGRLGRDMLQRQLVYRGDFAGDSVVAETIGAIRTDFRFDHRAMRAVFHAADIRAGKREARGELLRRRGNVDKIFQPVVDDFHRLFPLRRQPPRIKVRGVLHSHAAIFLIPAKEFAQHVHHRGEIRMAFLRNVRAAAQPPGEPVPVQELHIRQGVMQDFPAEEKPLHVVGLGVGVTHARIIRPIFHENVFIGPGERRLHFTEVPDGDDPALRPQNPPKLRPRFFRLEPVEGLARGDEVDAGILERSGLGRALDTREAVVGGEIFFAGLAHFGVWLDTINAISVLQKKLTQETRAGADVGDDMT